MNIVLNVFKVKNKNTRKVIALNKYYWGAAVVVLYYMTQH